MAIEAMAQFVNLVAALIVLGVASKYVIESAAKLARFFGISEMAIGFLLIAMLTSLPELSVAVISSTGGQNNLSLGDLMGSNVTNIALIIGITAYMHSSKRFDGKSVKSTIIFIGISLLPLLLIIDGHLGIVDSIILVAFYVYFVHQILSGNVPKNGNNQINKKEAATQFLILLGGMGAVLISSGLAVDSAVSLAETVGIFQSFVGATIIALGTSVPELAVNISAVKRGKWRLAIGNIVGSNVTNITLLLGINAGIRAFEPNLIMATPIAAFILISSAALGFVLWKNKRVSKRDGVMLLAIYVAYLLFLSTTQVIIHP